MLGALTDDATQGDFDANRGSRLIRERRMRPLVDPLSILVAEKNRSWQRSKKFNRDRIS